VDYWHLEGQCPVEKGLKIIEIAQRADAPQAEITALQWTVITLLGMGRVNEAEPLALAMLSTVEKIRNH